MPVRNGRWVSPAIIAAERKAAKEEAAKVAEEVPEAVLDTKRRPRRSRKAAEAAIAKATGVAVTISEEVE